MCLDIELIFFRREFMTNNVDYLIVCGFSKTRDAVLEHLKELLHQEIMHNKIKLSATHSVTVVSYPSLIRGSRFQVIKLFPLWKDLESRDIDKEKVIEWLMHDVFMTLGEPINL